MKTMRSSNDDAFAASGVMDVPTAGLTSRVRSIVRREEENVPQVILPEPPAQIHDDAVILFVDDPAPVNAPGLAPLSPASTFGLWHMASVLAFCAAGGLIPFISSTLNPAAQTAVAAIGIHHPDMAATGAVVAADRERLFLLGVQARNLHTTGVLDTTVRDLALDRDPEFAGQSSWDLSAIADLVSGRVAPPESSIALAQQRLAATVRVSLTKGGDALLVAASSDDAAKSARIANRMAENLLILADVDRYRATPIAAASPSIAADRALSDFKAQAGALAVATAEKASAALQDAVQQRAEAEARLVNDRKNLQSLSDAGTSGDGVDAAFPDLGDATRRLADARRSLAELSVSLGPLHPRFLAQQSVIARIEGDMKGLRQRAIAAAEATVKISRDELDLRQKRQAALEQQIRATGVDMLRLQQLEAARDDVLSTASVDTAPSATGGEDTHSAGRMGIVRRATASAPTGFDLTTSVLTGLLGGLAIGMLVVGLDRLLSRRHRRVAPVAVLPAADDDGTNLYLEDPPEHLEAALEIVVPTVRTTPVIRLSDVGKARGTRPSDVGSIRDGGHIRRAAR